MPPCAPGGSAGGGEREWDKGECLRDHASDAGYDKVLGWARETTLERAAHETREVALGMERARGQQGDRA